MPRCRCLVDAGLDLGDVDQAVLPSGCVSCSATAAWFSTGKPYSVNVARDRQARTGLIAVLQQTGAKAPGWNWHARSGCNARRGFGRPPALSVIVQAGQVFPEHLVVELQQGVPQTLAFLVARHRQGQRHAIKQRACAGRIG